MPAAMPFPLVLSAAIFPSIRFFDSFSVTFDRSMSTTFLIRSRSPCLPSTSRTFAAVYGFSIRYVSETSMLLPTHRAGCVLDRASKSAWSVGVVPFGPRRAWAACCDEMFLARRLCTALISIAFSTGFVVSVGCGGSERSWKLLICDMGMSR